MSARLCFWLGVLDLLAALGVRGRAYLWVLRRASDATDWGAPAEDCPRPHPGERTP